jgi:hypothetical protein
MRSSIEGLPLAHRASDKANGAEEIPARRARQRAAASSSAKLRRRETTDATLPILALRPTGDGTGLARALARVLVRRALRQERVFDTVEDCVTPTRSR